MANPDEIIFSTDSEPEFSMKSKQDTWKILIIDDDKDVHDTTVRILSDISVRNRTLSFYHAFNEKQAYEQLEQHADIAAILLDVVMEEDDSGLKIADYIRNVQKNDYTQVIIRSGQPGHAPERRVINQYEINNFLTKGDLTAQKLYTTIVGSIRAFDLSLRLKNEIVAHVQTLEDLKIKTKEAERAAIAKSYFLANMTHELKTPMHAIIGFSNLGIKKKESISPEKTQSYFQNINTSGHKLLELLNNLLDLSKLDVGQMDYLMKQNSVKHAVNMIINEFESLANKLGFRLDTIFNHQQDVVVFDLYKIIQVLRNLISNALKFSEAQKRIEITVSDTVVDRGELKVNAILFSVVDYGIGVPETEHQLIFDKFEESSRTRNEAGGKGLGLSICQKIIQSHQGKIWVSTNQNSAGSTFSFFIPTDLSEQSFVNGHQAF